MPLAAAPALSVTTCPRAARAVPCPAREASARPPAGSPARPQRRSLAMLASEDTGQGHGSSAGTWPRCRARGAASGARHMGRRWPRAMTDPVVAPLVSTCSSRKRAGQRPVSRPNSTPDNRDFDRLLVGGRAHTTAAAAPSCGGRLQSGLRAATAVLRRPMTALAAHSVRLGTVNHLSTDYHLLPPTETKVSKMRAISLAPDMAVSHWP